MRRFAPLITLVFFSLQNPVLAQLGPSVPIDEFRVEGRPGITPAVGPPGGQSLPPEPTFSRDSLGGQSPDEILKSIDKDLGKNSLDRSEPGAGGRPLDLERELRSPADKMFK
ncbi:MAG: hypothetical protein K0S45_3861 [Nitrospira sp.]|nr:hypothetical protein [Nitrospira sp.]